MAFITWENDKYSVGVENMDNQHMKLVDIINRLHGFLNMGESDDALKKTLKELHNYSDTHFKAEEAILENNGYPEIEAHKELHKVYMDKLVEFDDQLSKGVPPTDDVMFFVKDWLMNHIKEEDKKYKSYLNDKGIK